MYLYLESKVVILKTAKVCLKVCEQYGALLFSRISKPFPIHLCHLLFTLPLAGGRDGESAGGTNSPLPPPTRDTPPPPPGNPCHAGLGEGGGAVSLE